MLLAVLTISDRCSRGQMIDTAGPALVSELKAAWPQAEIETRLLPDDEEQIVAALLELSSLGAALVLTVGGTGLGPRDRTPEATRRVIDREAPGLAEAMRAKSSERNQYAWLSRGVAGLKGSTLIVNLPGSERGAMECWAAIAQLVRHGIEVIRGGQSHP
ncbi:MAG: MogA/MoaB family molybdenum cofactor biosynthesis protein [Terracidiphilus sp.]